MRMLTVEGIRGIGWIRLDICGGIQGSQKILQQTLQHETKGS